MMPTTDLSALRDHIYKHFDIVELQSLCFDLGVDFEELSGERKSENIVALILLLERRERLPELLTLLAEKRPTVPWASFIVQPTTDEKPPFMGLKYFDQEDADLFYGRETVTAVLLSNLQNNPFLAVVGASGSGKSSLVRAGVLPALPKDLSVHIITPGAHPLKELAVSLTRHAESVTAANTLWQDMQADANSLDLFVTRQTQAQGQDARLLLFIDQFEELFTACHDEAERQQFVANLMNATSPQTGTPLAILITLRADFYGHCAQYDALRQALAENQVYIGPMSEAELRQAIEKPADRFDWQFEPGLIDLMLRDVADEPGALPLLSHALLETWKRRQGRTLTLQGYTAAGGVSGAIAKTADSFFSSLTPDQQQLTRSIFMRLIEPGENTADTRRRAEIDELIEGDKNREEVEFLLKQLADARLITTGEGTVELAHESLITEWPRLRLWLDDNRDNLRIHRHLTESAQEWQALGRDPGELYRGVRLQQASEWAAATQPSLNQLEQEFLASSQAAQAQYETNITRRRILAGVALLVTFAALFLAVIIFSNQSRTNRQQAEQLGTSEAETQRQAVALSTAEQEAQTRAAEAVAAEATSAFSLQELSTAQARERATATAEAMQAATTQANLVAQATAQSDVDGDDLTFAEERQRGTNPNNADSDGDGQNDLTDPQPLRPAISPENADQLVAMQTIDEAHSGPVGAIALSGNGDLLASGGASDGRVKVWQTTDGSLETESDAPQGIIHTIAFDSFNDAIIVGSEGGGAAFWYPFDDTITAQTVRGVNTLYSLAVSPDAQILSFGGTGTTRIYGFNGDAFEQVARQDNSDNPNDRVTLAAFASDGEFFAMAEDHGRFDTVNIWQVNPFAVEFFYKFNNSVEDLASMALNSDGTQIAFGHVDGTIRVYELAENGRYTLLHEIESAHLGSVNTIQYSPDDSLLISGGADGVIGFWQTDDSTPVFKLTAHETGVQDAAISENGHILAAGGAEGTITVWAIPSREPVN
jgi:ABC-type Fe3+/spermidine/putrescine transport system ATPase subunit